MLLILSTIFEKNTSFHCCKYSDNVCFTYEHDVVRGSNRTANRMQLVDN